jgi:pSer/pThr/pTyr-binding forkhead associated (FHA) protein
MAEPGRAPGPFLVFQDGTGARVVRALGDGADRLTLGRHESCEIRFGWDERVSRTHAVLERVGQAWTLADDGLSRNGTFVNGERLITRHRLADGDAVHVGETLVIFREPAAAGSPTRGEAPPTGPVLSPAQRRVLVALCRPFKHRDAFTTPATNQQIADELVVSVDAVKTQMRGLFAHFGAGDLPQNRKRAEVVRRAFESGLVKERDL